MKTFKIKHWNGGDIDVTNIKAEGMEHARYLYYMNINTGDIISIEEVDE